MTNRIDKKFESLAQAGKKAFIAFITAGDPSLKKTAELVRAFEHEGVDIIELGVPFSDPLADGPVIQAASIRALKKGTDLRQILNLVREIRQNSQIPILLMSYLNPILRMGIDVFSKEAKECGVDGLIVPDLPIEEGAEISEPLKKVNIQLVYLLAPTSTKDRVKEISKSSRGFVYYVSLTGVTGSRQELPKETQANILEAKKHTKIPVCVGFGISSPDQARAVSKSADGVIVGSVIIEQIDKHPHMSAEQFAANFIKPFTIAIKGK